MTSSKSSDDINEKKKNGHTAIGHNSQLRECFVAGHGVQLYSENLLVSKQNIIFAMDDVQILQGYCRRR